MWLTNPEAMWYTISMETNEIPPEDLWEEQRDKRESLWTFGLEYKHGDEVYVEEIDLWAVNADEAERRAKAVADFAYEPGWQRLVPMSPGGSAGLVFF